jgi:hypothetical protein
LRSSSRLDSIIVLADPGILPWLKIWVFHDMTRSIELDAMTPMSKG